ncbi:hypothetical protein LCGC14_1081610 [marine sediment metagenome]|uniref:Uncharacterized protein n=1 Tax=marine sediment metagenome TaxID=412755 RepID=A0A0F9MF62_9ZZZZ
MESAVVGVRAMLASAVGHGIMIRGIMKNKNKTPFWYFGKTEVEESK